MKRVHLNIIRLLLLGSSITEFKRKNYIKARRVTILIAFHENFKRFTYVQMEKAVTPMKEVLVMPPQLSVPVLPAKIFS